MAEATALEFTKMYTQLAGRQVTVTQLKQAPPDSKKHLFGVYSVVPAETTRLIKADIALIGSLGGALLGLPKDVVVEGLQETPMDEVIRDAMHEVMNVSATLVSVDHRAIFRKMFTDVATLPDNAKPLLKSPKPIYFQATIAGYNGGAFTLLT